MKLLVIGMSPQFLRPFVKTVRELAGRGHRVTVAWHDESRGGEAHLAELDDCPGVTLATVPGRRSEHREEVALIRRGWNYLRYLDKPYRGADKLRHRAFSKVARVFFDLRTDVPPEWSDTGLRLSSREWRRLSGLLEFMERQLPTDPVCDTFLASEHPDAVLLTPLVDLNSSTQADFAQSARRMGIPVGMLVYSWDNLSTKGGLHVMPDHVFVWNNRQAREARDLHGVPKDAISVVGAPRFDAFLESRLTVKRAVFAKGLGVDPARPILAYICSSAFVSNRELEFVRQWLAALRGAPDERIRHATVLVRPHPDIPLLPPGSPAEKVAIGPHFTGTVWRPFDDRTAMVLATSSRAVSTLFEFLAHSDAVVGLNTSAEIEAGALGKPVLSIKAGRTLADGQDSLHFRYLLREEGGWVDAADSLATHVTQLSAALSRPDEELSQLRLRAVRFIRPNGRKQPVGPQLARAIEAWVSSPASPPIARGSQA